MSVDIVQIHPMKQTASDQALDTKKAPSHNGKGLFFRSVTLNRAKPPRIEALGRFLSYE